MKLHYLTALPLLGLFACQQEQPRPNIIIILADDMGYSDLGCYGSEIHTPNLDSLAAQGQRHIQFYNAGRCCPSRASLLTGLYAHETGVGHMTHDDSLPGYRGYLNNQCKTLAEVLKPAGYDTYMSGKWHVGEKPERWPRKRGFDRYFGLINGASSFFDHLPYRPGQKNMTILLDDSLYIPSEGFYMTNATTDFALEFIRENQTQKKKNPFFLYLSYTAPHWPLHALPEDIAKYKGAYDIGWDSLRQVRYNNLKQLGMIPPGALLSERDPVVPEWNSLTNEEKVWWASLMEVYAAMIDNMDQNIGKLITHLKETGEYDNTIIMFMSDNGGCHAPTYVKRDGVVGTANSFEAYLEPWANVSNTPYRMFKHWTAEGGIITPFIIRYPGVVKPNTIHRTPLHIINIMPTVLEIAGANYQLETDTLSLKSLPVKSMMPYLKEDTFDAENHQPLFWEHGGNRAYRKANWKIVSSYDSKNDTLGRWELYNLETDPSEIIDLAASNNDLLNLLIGFYEKDAQKYNVVPYNEIKRIRKLRQEK